MIASESPEDCATLYPFVFHPIFKERIWGGRNLERLYQKPLPPDVAIGESWEVVDRTEDDSLIANGPLAGKSLHWLMENHRDDLLGPATPAESNRFPLLVKILDAHQKLSLQVHPPKSKCGELGGEPKTELWFVSDATPEADNEKMHLFQRLHQALAQLNMEQRQVITLVDLQELSYREVADVLDIPIGTVMSRVCRGWQQLKQLLHDLEVVQITSPSLWRVK